MARVWTFDEFVQSLEQRLDGLLRGQVSFGDLPPALSAWFFAGEAAGRAARQLEIEQLERQLNRLHNLAFTTDKERREQLEARLSQALEVASEERWEQLERDLRAMVAQRDTQAAGAAQAMRAEHTSAERGQQCQPTKTTFGTQDRSSQRSGNGHGRAA